MELPTPLSPEESTVVILSTEENCRAQAPGQSPLRNTVSVNVDTAAAIKARAQALLREFEVQHAALEAEYASPPPAVRDNTPGCFVVGQSQEALPSPSDPEEAPRWLQILEGLPRSEVHAIARRLCRDYVRHSALMQRLEAAEATHPLPFDERDHSQSEIARAVRRAFARLPVL